MAFPKHNDYKQHDGVYGDPVTWRRKAGSVVTEVRAGEEEIQAALMALGFDRTARPSQREVKVAFRTKAVETHPDHGGTDADFNQIKTAFDVLLADSEIG